MMAALKAWLRKEGLWLYAGSVSSDLITHLFLDGGKASVPFNRMQEFFAEYASCVHAGDIPRVVERLSAVGSDGDFRMFMDIDLKDFQGDLRKTARHVLSALPDELDVGDVVVCNKTSKASKEGLHLVWDSVYVSAKDALRLLAITVSNLKSLFPDAVTDWLSALDGSVYKNSGLRMVYSAKNDKDRAAYVPWFVSHQEENSRITIDVVDAANVEAWLDRCSIIKTTGRTKKTPESTKKATGRHPEGGAKRQRPSELDDDDVHAALNVILEGTPYQGCSYHVNVGSACNIIRLDSKYCFNIGKEHRSNNAYLVVSRHSVQQACHCKCQHTGCAAHRKVIAGRNNPVSAIYFPPKPVASVRPSVGGSNVMRWSVAIARQRESRRV